MFVCLSETYIYSFYIARFLYTENVDITPDTVMALMYSAKKYSVQMLVQKCCDYLTTEMNSDNVCTILEQAHVFDEDKLRDHCLKAIISDSNKVMKSPLKDYQNLCHLCLKEIMQSDQLQSKEETLFIACLNWAEEQCRLKGIEINDINLREVLGDILFLIRFPFMDKKTFGELVADRNLLTADEKFAVNQQFNMTPRDREKTNREGFRFESRPRMTTDVLLQTVLLRATRFQEVLGGQLDFWDNDNDADAISFMCSRQINLFGVTVFRPLPNGIIRGCIKIFDESYWCMTKRGNLEIVGNDADDTMMDIKFKGSVKIIANRWYTVTQELQGDKSFYGMKGQKRVQGQDVLITFRKSPMDTNNTNVESGQIPALLYTVAL